MKLKTKNAKSENHYPTEMPSDIGVGTFELRENTTEQTGAPSCACSNVLTHLLLTPSQILILPSFDAVTYMLALALYFTCMQLLYVLVI